MPVFFVIGGVAFLLWLLTRQPQQPPTVHAPPQLPPGYSSSQTYAPPQLPPPQSAPPGGGGLPLPSGGGWSPPPSPTGFGPWDPNAIAGWLQQGWQQGFGGAPPVDPLASAAALAAMGPGHAVMGGGGGGGGGGHHHHGHGGHGFALIGYPWIGQPLYTQLDDTCAWALRMGSPHTIRTLIANYAHDPQAVSCLAQRLAYLQSQGIY